MTPFAQKFNAYKELTKPRILMMVLITTGIGFFFGSHGQFLGSWLRLLETFIGTGMASAGAAALNHCLERDADALMDRTKNRPIPTGVISPLHAMVFGLSLTLAGVFFLKIFVGLLPSFLVLLTAFLYVLVYTPLKRLTWFNTFVGAIPGALPPMVGWAAAAGQLQVEAWILFLILFAWQHPHFYAIAWMFKEDYARGGFKMLPSVDETGHKTFQHVVFYSALLFVISALPYFVGMAGKIYLVGALVLGAGFFAYGIVFVRNASFQTARQLLRASVIYFPLLLVLILVDAQL